MKTVILLDFDCLNEAVQKLDVELDANDFLAFLKSIHEDSDVQTAYAYVGINEKLPHVKDKIIDELTRAGYIVRKVLGDNYGINFVSDCSQAITLDALRSIYENEATNVVLVSNSHKLENLVTLLREKDVMVDTVFYGSLVDYDLAVKSTGFINLEDFISDDEEDTDNQEYLDHSNDDNDDEDTEDTSEFEAKNNTDEDAEDDNQYSDETLTPIKVNDSDIVIIGKDNKGDNE